MENNLATEVHEAHEQQVEETMEVLSEGPLSAGALMYLATDYIHPYRGVTEVRSRCRIRLYLPQEDRDAAVVICSKLPDNPGTPVVDAAEQIAAEIIKHFILPSPPVWIEHHLQESTNG